MRLFLIAFSLSAFATFATSWSHAQDPDRSGSQPIKQSRFEMSEAQIYRMNLAREEDAFRIAILRRYDAMGFNYGAPEINGNVFFNARPPVRFRRAFVTPFISSPSYFGNYGM